MEYAFELPSGYWLHIEVSRFRNTKHAKQYAAQSGFVYRGRYRMPDMSNAAGSAAWCETQSDNR